MAMRIAALALTMGMVLSALGCGFSDAESASRRRGAFGSEKGGPRPADAESSGAMDSERPVSPVDSLRRDLDRLRAEEKIRAGRVHDLRSGLSEGETLIASEEGELAELRKNIEQYEAALGEGDSRRGADGSPRSPNPFPGRDAPYAPGGIELAQARSGRFAPSRSIDGRTFRAPGPYAAPPRAEVRGIPDPRDNRGERVGERAAPRRTASTSGFRDRFSPDSGQQTTLPPSFSLSDETTRASQENSEEVLFVMPPSSPSGAMASASRDLSALAAPTFPAPRPPRRQPAVSPIPDVPALWDAPHEAAAGAPSTPAPETAAPSSRVLPGGMPHPADPGISPQSHRTPPSAARTPDAVPMDSGDQESGEIFIPDLYLGGGR